MPVQEATPVWSECDDGIVALAVRAYARGEKKRAILTKCEPSRKRYNTRWNDVFPGAAEIGGECYDASDTSQSDMIAAIRPEITAARIEAVDPTAVTHDIALRIKGEHTVGTAV